MFDDECSGCTRRPGDSATRDAAEAAAPGRDSVARLDSASLVDRLVGLRAEAARREAEMLALMAEFVQARRREDADGPGTSVSGAFAVDELALALVSTRHRVRQQLGLAEALGNELSATGELLGTGRIDGYQAWVIHDMISRLVGDEHIAEVEAAILARAPGLTGGQIRSRLAKLIAAKEPDAFSRRHQRAMRDRRVSANPGGSGDQLDGMGSLWLSHAAVDIAAIDDKITQIARAQTRSHAGAGSGVDDGDGDGDGRSFDNVRADVVRDILLGRHQPGVAAPGKPGVSEPAATGDGSAAADTHPTGEPESADPPAAGDGSPTGDTHPAGEPESADRSSGPSCGGGAQVFVTVPIQTLMGIDDAPGELLGYGPIPAAVARAIASAGDSVWRRMLTDPAGNLVDLSTTSYRPGRVLDLAVTVRDGTSRFPRSNASAVGADFDHTIRYPAGETSYRNGGKLTRRDHRVKHAPGWTVTQPEPGHFVWTTPTGHTYTVGPADRQAGTWPAPWQLDPDPPDLDELMDQLARAPDYLDDHLLHELGIDPPDE